IVDSAQDAGKHADAAYAPFDHRAANGHIAERLCPGRTVPGDHGANRGKIVAARWNGQTGGGEVKWVVARQHHVDGRALVAPSPRLDANGAPPGELVRPLR